MSVPISISQFDNGDNNMGYPKPVPAIKARNIEEFEKKLANFKLTEKQKEFYREMFKKIEKNKH